MKVAIPLLLGVLAVGVFALYAAGVLGPAPLDEETATEGVRVRAPKQVPRAAEPRRPAAPAPAAERPRRVPALLVLEPGADREVPGEPAPPDSVLNLPADQGPIPGAEVLAAVSRLAPLRFEDREHLHALRALEVPPPEGGEPLRLEHVLECWRQAGFAVQEAGRALFIER